MSHRIARARGFSLLELLVVIAMGLVIAAVAVPNMMIVIANYRLSSGMSSLSGLLQNCRMTAVQKNTSMSAHFTIMAHGPVAYVKPVTDTGSINSMDPQVQLGAPVSKVTSLPAGGPTALDNTVLGFAPLTSDPSFNSRGLPCSYASGVCTTGVGFVFYFTDTRPLGASGWGAVTITPAGRVRTWSWNGAAWK